MRKIFNIHLIRIIVILLGLIIGFISFNFKKYYHGPLPLRLYQGAVEERLIFSDLTEINKAIIYEKEEFLKHDMRVVSKDQDLYHGDFDNDGKLDIISENNTLHIKLSLKNLHYRRKAGLSYVSAAGFDDLDVDGFNDIWYFDSGNDRITILYGDGKGDIDTSQIIYDIPDYVYMTCIDHDGDNDLDIILSTDNFEKQAWIKVTRN